MTGIQYRIEHKTFTTPDETRPFAGHGNLALVQVGGRDVGRATFEPGWRWSVDVKPLAGTNTCQVSHLGYCLEGRMRVTMDDGTSAEVGPGDAFAIPPGHDAEVLGDTACVMLDFGEVGQYATKH